MAAVLACGANAVLSHRSAARLWGMLGGQGGRPHVTTTTRAGRAIKGIVAHNSTALRQEDVTAHRRIPATTVARTILDLAADEPRQTVERCMDEAEVQGILDVRALAATLAHANSHRGAGTLRAILDDRREPALTRLELEARFLALCREADLPEPKVNHWILVDDEN